MTQTDSFDENLLYFHLHNGTMMVGNLKAISESITGPITTTGGGGTDVPPLTPTPDESSSSWLSPSAISGVRRKRREKNSLFFSCSTLLSLSLCLFLFLVLNHKKDLSCGRFGPCGRDRWSRCDEVEASKDPRYS